VSGTRRGFVSPARTQILTLAAIFIGQLGQQMKKGCLIAGVILGVIVILFIYGFLTAFGPEYDNAEINQNIGGTLICNSVYNADHHSWQYDVTYKYKLPNGSTMDIGSGTYYGREWNKDEQLIQYNNWTILKTGGWIGTDKLIIGDIKTKKWTEYPLSPEDIEKNILWRESQPNSLLNWCCSEVFVDKIDKGQIWVRYKFRTSETKVHEYGQRTIYYTIDNATGQLTMTKVE
jgi:hypothetical protein